MRGLLRGRGSAAVPAAGGRPPSQLSRTLTVEARPEDIPRVRSFVEEALGASTLSDRARREIRLAVDEACTNIIEHAYAGRRGSIGVEVSADCGEVAITLRDTGKAFDPHAIGTPDLSRYVKTGKKGGFGLFLIHKMMDEVRYVRSGDSNVLTLVKRAVPGQPAPAVLAGARLAPRLRIRSLRLRFFVQASLLLTLLVACAALVLLERAGALARREALQRGVALATGLRAQAADFLLRPQAFGPKQTQLNAAVKAAAVRGQIAFLVVTDSSGTVWAASKEEIVLTPFVPPPATTPLRPEAEGVASALAARSRAVRGDHVLALPVLAPGGRSASRTRLGTIYVSVRAAALEREVAAARREVLVVASLVLAAGLAAVGFLVRLVVKPIQRLTEGVRAIGAGREQRLEEAGLEELDAIARVVNEAMEQVRDAQQSQVEQERLQQEVQVAKSIQQSLLPRALPEMAGFEIGTLYRAAKEVGGDYYDFVKVGDDVWGLVVADVSGKGVPASMVMMMIRTALRLEARGKRSAAEVLDHVNSFVTADMKKGMFVTMFYVVLDSRERELTYASAGHNPLILYRAPTEETFFLKPSGFPVGIDLPDETLFGRTMAVERVALEQGDLLVAYTDGITEAMNSQKEQFGTHRLLAAIKHHAHLPPQEFCLQLERELADFTGDTPQNDDMTLVAIKERLSATDLKVEARQRLLDLVEVEGVPVPEACRRLAVSPSTYYRYRRLRQERGLEGLRDHRKRRQPARLSNEQEAMLLQLVGEDPDRGARRLAEALAKVSGQEVQPARVAASLRRLGLNNRAARRALAEVPGGSLPGALRAWLTPRSAGAPSAGRAGAPRAGRASVPSAGHAEAPGQVPDGTSETQLDTGPGEVRSEDQELDLTGS